MQECTDGSYGDIQPAPDILAKLQSDVGELEKTAAVHFGTAEELIAKKEEPSILERLDCLDKKINRLLLHFGLANKGEILIVPEGGPR